jgi:hypothetical protein
MTERAIQKDFICIREFLNEEMSVLRILFDDRDDRIEAMQLIRIHSRVLIFFQTQFETHVVIQLVRDQRIISITISLMHVYEQTKVRQRLSQIEQNQIEQIQFVIEMRIRQDIRSEHIRHALQLMRQITAEILRKSFSHDDRIRDMFMNQRLIE